MNNSSGIFWWGHEKGEKKVHWIAWEKLTSPKLLGGLGFRDIRCFNQALLARQAWRLIESPDSLCARVLKAKYYPNGTITDIAFPSVSSPTWKGIVHGLELLKKGLIWRIGDGRKTKIWRNHWVAHGENLKILEKKTWNRLIYVRELIVTDTKTWNEPLIRHIIREEDADEILKIRIPQREEEDFPAWHYEKTGIFSVRSAYRLAWNLARKTSEQASSSSGGADGRKIWDNVWKANVQPKVRVFAWKLAQDKLATWENKKKRKIEMFGTCPICGQKEETGFHATVECTLAKPLRASLREHWTLPDESLFSMTGPDWLLVLLDRLSSEKKAQVLYLLWRAWYIRNEVVHGKGNVPITDSVRFLINYDNLQLPARKHMEDIKGKGPMFQDPGQKEQTCQLNAEKEKWSCPPDGSAKLNVDAAYRTETGEASAGIIIRDCRG